MKQEYVYCTNASPEKDLILKSMTAFFWHFPQNISEVYSTLLDYGNLFLLHLGQFSTSCSEYLFSPVVWKSQHYPPVNCGVEDKVGSCFLRTDCVDPYPQKDAICEKKETSLKGLCHAILN